MLPLLPLTAGHLPLPHVFHHRCRFDAIADQFPDIYKLETIGGVGWVRGLMLAVVISQP